MNNELMPTTVSDISNLGKLFFESGMFADIKSASQAVVKICAGKEVGIPPFAAMSGIHIIQGKPVIGAGLIASMVKGSGKYDYKVIQQDEKACSIDFYQGKEKIGNSTFTIEDAKKAGTKNLDKFPKNMLFARAISNGVKWFAADVFAGPVYTPEEMEQQVTEDVKATVTTSNTKSNLKPAITDKQFKATLDKIQAGQDVIGKAQENFTLTDGQVKEMEHLKSWVDTLSQADERELNELAVNQSAEFDTNIRVRELFAKRQSQINVPA